MVGVEEGPGLPTELEAVGDASGLVLAMGSEELRKPQAGPARTMVATARTRKWAMGFRGSARVL